MKDRRPEGSPRGDNEVAAAASEDDASEASYQGEDRYVIQLTRLSRGIEKSIRDHRSLLKVLNFLALQPLARHPEGCGLFSDIWTAT